MATLLASGGTVELWGGWVVRLPPASTRRIVMVHGRHGGDWTVDVIIIEVAG
jgi:hypothetical protein